MDEHGSLHFIAKGKLDKKDGIYSSPEVGLKKLDLSGKNDKYGDVETAHSRYDANCDTRSEPINYLIDKSVAKEKIGGQGKMNNPSIFCERDGGSSSLPSIAIKDDKIYMFKEDESEVLHLYAQGKFKKDGKVYTAEDLGLDRLEIFEKNYGAVENKQRKYDVICNEKGETFDYIDDLDKK